ncbi:unnamed protein product [Closterium sp. Yama58-4]|nr:unnamed protein product [Closterium sp. Yama58-4]
MEDAKYTAIPLSWRESSGELRVHESADDISRGLADVIVRASEAAIASHGAFTIAISGGSVVKCLGQLAHPDVAARCDWSRWHVFWVDERAVPLTHPDSNYLLAHTHWLSKVPIPPAHIHTLDDSLPVEAAAEAYEREMKECVEAGALLMHPDTAFPRFDFILLGVGPDGHVASLFPSHPLLSTTSPSSPSSTSSPSSPSAPSPYWCRHLCDSPKPPPCRITLTLPVLLSAAVVAVVAMGEGKRELLGRLFEAGGAGFAVGTGLPASMVLPRDGWLIWMVDNEAAAGFLQSS